MLYSQTKSSRNLVEFGKKLATFREANKISRNDLAGLVNVSQEHIWRLENGFRGCSRDLTIIIGQVLSLDIDNINQLLLLAGHRPMIKKGGFSEIRFSHK